MRKDLFRLNYYKEKERNSDRKKPKSISRSPSNLRNSFVSKRSPDNDYGERRSKTPGPYDSSDAERHVKMSRKRRNFSRELFPVYDDKEGYYLVQIGEILHDRCKTLDAE
jgi:hypothetical protein